MSRLFVKNTELLTKHEYDSTRIGENLIKGSALTQADASKWSPTSGAKVRFNGDITVLAHDVTQYIFVKPNTTYTFSWILDFIDVNASDTGFYFVEQKNLDANTEKYEDHQYTFKTGKIVNTTGLHTFTFTTQSDCQVLWMVIRYEGSSPNGFQIDHPKLETGSVATPWCPAREDYAMQSDVIKLQDQINQLKSKLGG